MSTSHPNRNKFLLGFSAVVAVLIVAFFMWPANIQKDDVSGSIGAVQKHHAPQITQQDVILGGESVKHQQKVLSTDFLADAAKLRAIGARDAAARQQLAREAASRWQAEARYAYDRANAAARFSGQAEQMQAKLADLESLAQKSALNDQEMSQFDTRLQEIEQAANVAQAAARLNDVEQSMSRINLANAQTASRLVADVEQSLNRMDADIELAGEEQYLAMMQTESRVLNEAEQSQARLGDFAQQLEQRAQNNISQAAANEEQIGMRLQRILSDVEIAAGRTTANKAGMMATESLNARLGALAQRMNQRVASSREFVAMRSQRELDARQK